MKKILIVNPFGIGDVIFSMPLVDVLKKRFPNSFIGYVCNSRVSEIIKASPFIDRIFIYEKEDYRIAWKRSKTEFGRKLWLLLDSIRNERFDISIDLSLNYQCSMFLWFLGIRKRLGFNYRNRGKFLTDKIRIECFEGKHVVENYLDILRLLKVDANGCEIKPRVYVADSALQFADEVLRKHGIRDDDIFIGMIPGCGESWGVDAENRRWDKKRFAALADMIIDRYGAKIVLLGNTQEKGICDGIERMMKRGVINYCGKTSIGEFLGILKRCRMVITNDGGPLHMAVGLGVKTVSIFGPVDERTYGPYGENSKHLMVKKDLPCRPCYRKFKYKKCEDRICLDLITVEEMFEAVGKMISQ